jgi:hypothetical protein
MTHYYEQYEERDADEAAKEAARLAHFTRLIQDALDKKPLARVLAELFMDRLS